jgi:alkylhydroperoxidase family enzyme
MPRISRIDRAQAPPEVAEVFDQFMNTRGNVPNMFRTAAHRPEIMRTMVAHFRAVMETGTVPARLKELVIVRTTQINQCEY